VSEESLKQTVLRRMEQLGIEPKRSLGQNFLINPEVVKKIIARAEPGQFAQVIEVGPGLGVLTDPLREAHPSALTLMELDRDLSQWWREQGLNVIEGDVLKYDWSNHPWPTQGEAMLVSNLPYQVSSRLVVELSIQPQTFQRMVLMFQKEVAQRVTAPVGSGEYGLLSVVAQIFWRIQKVAEAGSRDFYPSPKVLSRVLAFERKATDSGFASKEFLSFLKICFSLRRKKLGPQLKKWTEQPDVSLAEVGADSNTRPQQLSPDQYQQLFMKLVKGRNGN
jgi:16S rRNA (adenine1518-N6/adenine1519-N6)-dimethyltransferase